MGFFKKIGAAVKGVTKKITLRGALKTVGTVASLAPGIGGIAGGVINNLVAAREQEKADQAAQQAYAQEVADAGAYVAPQISTTKGINLGQIGTAAAGGALTAVGGVLAGTKEAGQAGATLVDSTISAWLKMHWWKLLGGAGVLFGAIWYMKRPKGPTYGRKRR